jgi:glycosyltransferase involved in cell wall biosynthesis
MRALTDGNMTFEHGGPGPAHGGRLRVLVISHSHPKLTRGGAEIAAFRLFTELSARDDTEAWFLGCDTSGGGGRDGVAITQPFSDREYVYAPGGHFNWFRFANGDPNLQEGLVALLLELAPNVIHLHHYANLGVETLLTIRRRLPTAKIIVTLHEYLAICNHFGQMITRGQFTLCDASGLSSCHKCFPEIAPSDFFIREQYIKLFFEHVDHFIAPSHFLLSRYRDWGLETSRLSMIENITAPASHAAEGTQGRESSEKPLRVGFFGQISKLKGMGVLLDCAAILAADRQARISIDIFGDYSGQPQAFQDEFLEQIAKCSHNVNYRGPYRQDQVDRLMRSVDAVLVPSIWWENSPVVIQEALRNGRPVICSDIGGMAEKVRDGIDGFHFPVGSGLELSFLLMRLHDDRTLLDNVRRTLTRPATVSQVLEDHIRLYRHGAGDLRPPPGARSSVAEFGEVAAGTGLEEAQPAERFL